MQHFSNAFRVGVLVTAGVLGWLFWFFNTSKGQLGGADTIGVFAYFKNAKGLSAKSKVTAAGLDVGQIANISLVNLDLVPVEAARCAALRHDESRRAQELAPCAAAWSGEPAAALAALQQCVCGKAGGWRFPARSELPRYEVELPLLPRRARFVLAVEPDGKVGECRVEAASAGHTAPECRDGFWARVDLRVKKAFPLYVDCKVEKSTLGLMGSNVLELYSGDPEKSQIEDGGEIVTAIWQSGLEAAFSTVGDLEGEIQDIVGNVNGITASINDFFRADTAAAPPPSFPELMVMLQDRMEQLTVDLGHVVRQVDGFLGENRGNITDAIKNLTRVSDELRDIAEGTGERGMAFDKMVTNVAETTEQLRAVVTELRTLLGAAEEQVEGGAEGEQPPEQLAAARQQVRGLRETVERLNESLDALAQVTQRIAAGEGTVGRLLTDDKIANDLEDAIEGASDLVSGINRLDTHVKVLAWYNFNSGTAHDGISLRLQPRPDKYYLLELMSDPRPTPTYRWVTTQTNDPLHGSPTGTAGDTTVVEMVTETTDSFSITAMFAKMWGPLTLRVGVLENSGAVGANLDFWERRVRLRSDMYQFGYIGRLPRWRNYLEFEPIDHVFVIAGLDDLINYTAAGIDDPALWGELEYFAGAGIAFTDEDLKSLLTIVPTP